MIKTFKFVNSKRRDEFISVIKELWFKYSLNTYSQVVSSKSEVNDHLIWNGRDVKTTNNSVIYYEITVDKDLDNEEEIKFNKLTKLFFYKRNNDNLFSNIVMWFLSWWFITIILFIFIGNNFVDLWNMLLNTKLIYLIGIIIIGLFSYLFNKISKEDKEKQSKEITELKDFLLNEYLWEYWKKLISTF